MEQFSVERSLDIKSLLQQSPTNKSSSKRHEFTTCKSNLFVEEGDTIDEDTRITKFVFQKYILVELGWTLMLIGSLILGVIAADNEYFADQSLKQSLLLYSLFAQTIVLEILTISSWYLNFQYQLQCNNIAEGTNFFFHQNFLLMLIEMMIQAPHPTPFYREIRIYYTDQSLFQDHFYYINEILTFFQQYRVILAYRGVLKLIPAYYNDSVARIYKFYSLNMDVGSIVKCLIMDFPFTLQFTIYLSGTYMFAMQFRLAERPMDRTYTYDGTPVINWEGIQSSYRLALWIVTITIPTVGYGDFTAYTFLGRMSMFFCVMWGTNMTALFLASLMSTLSIMRSENLSFALMDRIITIQIMKGIASEIMTRLGKLFMGAKQKTLSPSRVKQMVDHIAVKNTHMRRVLRAYSEIDGEGLGDMMDRNFKFLRHSNKEMKQILGLHHQKLSEVKMAIPQYMPELKSFHTFQTYPFLKTSVKEPDINPQYVLSGSLFQKKIPEPQQRSKDDKFFENLEESQRSQLEIILFDDSR